MKMKVTAGSIIFPHVGIDYRVSLLFSINR